LSLLPPAIQTFGIQAGEYLAGIGDMLGQTDDFAAGIDAATASAARMGAEFDATAAGMDEMAASFDRAAAAGGQLGASSDAVVGGLDAEVAAFERDLEAAGLMIDAKGRLRLMNGQFASSEDIAAAGLDLETEAAERAGVATESYAGKTAAAKDASIGFGTVMKTAFLGIGLAAAYGIDKAAGFQSSMEQLHTQAGVAQSQIKGLSQGVLELSGQVGEGPDSLAESLYHVASNMASTGATGTQMLDAVKVAAMGAQVGNANLVDVTNALGAAIASGIPGVQNYTQAMGYMNATVGAGDMQMQDLAEAFGTGVLANIKMYGVTLQDVSAALATYGDNNIRGAKAGTDLRMAVQAIVAPVSTAGSTLKMLGLTTTSLADRMKTGGLNGALEMFIQHLQAAKVPAKDYGEILTDVFGKKAGSGIGVLVGEFDRFQGKYAQVKEGADSFASDWNARTKTMSQQWHDLVSGAQSLAISFGSVLLPAATSVVGALARVFVFFEKDPVLAAFAGAILAVAAAFKVVATAEKIFEAVTAADPVMLVLIAVIALAAGLYELYEHFKIVRDVVADFGHFFAAAWRDIKAAAIDAWHFLDSDVLRPIEDGVSGLVSFVRGHWQMLAIILGGLLLGPVGALVVFLAEHWKTVAHDAEAAAHAIAAPFLAMWHDLTAWWQSYGGEITEVWRAIWDVISTVTMVQVRYVMVVAEALGRYLAATWNLVYGITRGAWDIIWGVVSGVMGVIAAVVRADLMIISDIWDVTWAAILLVVRVAWAAISTVIRVTWDLIAATVKIGWDLLVGIFSVFLDLVTGHWSKAWQDVQKTFGQVWNAIRSFAGQAFNAVESGLRGFLNAVRSYLSSVIGVFARIPGQAMSALSGLVGSMISMGRDIIGGLLSGIRSAVGGLLSYVGGIGHDISSTFAGVLHILSPSRVMYGHGQNVVLGVAQGITSAAPQVIASVNAMGAALRAAGAEATRGLATGMMSVEDELRAVVTQLGDLAEQAVKDRLQISSPSKVTYNLGVMTGQGLADGITYSSQSAYAAALKTAQNTSLLFSTNLVGGLEGTASQVSSTITKMMSAVQSELNAGLISQGRASGLASYLQQDNWRLQALANQRASIAKTIAAARSYAATTTSNTEQAFGIVSAGGSTPLTAGDIASSLHMDVDQIVAFKNNIGKLARMGLNKAYIDQLIQAGPVQGGQIAAELAAGSWSDIRSINTAEGQIASASTSLGYTAADAMYDSGAQAGKGFMSGLRSQQESIVLMMQRLAEAAVNTMKRELKISSPSQVFREHGLMTALGYALGIEDGIPRVGTSAKGLSAAAYAPYSGGLAAGAGAGGGTMTINVHVDGYVGNNQELATEIYRVVQTEALRFNHRNPSNGLALAAGR